MTVINGEISNQLGAKLDGTVWLAAAYHRPVDNVLVLADWADTPLEDSAFSAEAIPGPARLRVEAGSVFAEWDIVVPDEGPVEVTSLMQDSIDYPEPVILAAQAAATTATGAASTATDQAVRAQSEADRAESEADRATEQASAASSSANAAESSATVAGNHATVAGSVATQAAQAAVAEVVDGAPEALDTLRELAEKATDNSDQIATLLTMVGSKAEKSSFQTVTAAPSSPTPGVFYFVVEA